MDEKTVRNIFRDFINELEAQFRFETPKWMGIDEIHLIRSRCVISNIRNNTIVNLLPNRDKKTVATYLSKLDGKEEVQYVAMDMWTPYRDACLAYRLKEDFYSIYEAKGPQEAMQRYERWNHSVTPDVRDAFHDLIRAWENWIQFILTYFEHPVTNAYTESLNSLIRVMNRLGRGYSFEALRAKILFTEGIHKHKPSRLEVRAQGARASGDEPGTSGISQGGSAGSPTHEGNPVLWWTGRLAAPAHGRGTTDAREAGEELWGGHKHIDRVTGVREVVTIQTQLNPDTRIILPQA